MFFSSFDKLFTALDRKVVGFLKLTDCLLILSCVHKRFILFITTDLFSSAVLSDMFKQSFAMLSGGWFSRWIQNLKTWKLEKTNLPVILLALQIPVPHPAPEPPHPSSTNLNCREASFPGFQIVGMAQTGVVDRKNSGLAPHIPIWVSETG